MNWANLSGLLAVIAIALVFTYLNGFHDTANSIATVIGTGVLTPAQAVGLAAVTNLAGALLGSAVALTIATGLINSGVAQAGSEVLICALLGATFWDLATWWSGVPTSSSHALIGGLCGAALAAAHDNVHAIIWMTDPSRWWAGGGLMPKVIVPMVGSSIAGFGIGILAMGALFVALVRISGLRGKPRELDRIPSVNRVFRKAQLFSASAVGIAHGMNDAQKTMGIIALALADATAAHDFDHLSAGFHFLRVTDPDGQLPIPVWVKLLCALVMAAGTASGGWRIIRTLGCKLVRLHPVNGFAAEASSAGIILVSSLFGLPVSTTQVVAPAIMGVGAARGVHAVSWGVAGRIVGSWLLTLPCSMFAAWSLVELSRPLWRWAMEP